MSPVNQKPATGAESLLAGLADSGVDVCFSNPGTSELDLVAALEQEDRIRTVPVAFEGVATGAADGYARMSSRPAATLLHLAPGLHNAAANLHNAMKACTPMVNLVGDHARSHREFSTPLSADLEAIAAPSSVWHARVDKAPRAYTSARRAATETVQRSGPVTLLVSSEACWSPPGEPDASDTVQTGAAPGELGDIGAAAAALGRASKPAILVGGHGLTEPGLWACARLHAHGIRVLSEQFPARQSRGAGRFSPENLQYFTEAAQQQLAGTDLMVVVGTAPPAGTFAYLDRPARPLPPGCAELVLKTDPRRVAEGLGALADALGAPSAPVSTSGMGETPERPAGAITLRTLATCLRRQLPENAIVSDDGVTASGFAFMACGDGPAHEWLKLTGGALGLGIPMAIGAALAAPARKTICLTGDGAALYTLASLWTLAREKLDVTVLVVANRSYDILKVELGRMSHIEPVQGVMRALDLSPPEIDHVAIAKGFGIEAVRCTGSEELDSALATAISSPGPRLVEAVCDSVVPG
jgi:acetolactate synthase I/II/III large subunit